MSEDSPSTPESGTASAVSPEFFIKVNDFIQMANRIERRLDTHHAQLAFLHAFARYSAHHYKTSASSDDELNRKSFANYTAGAVEQLVLQHLEDLAGPSAQQATPDVASDTASE